MVYIFWQAYVRVSFSNGVQIRCSYHSLKLLELLELAHRKRQF